MADPAPTKRPMPVGYRFHPTDEELVGHYLHRKLMADDLSIHDTIPEIDVCKYEPWDLLAWTASADLATKFDDFQCYFFRRRDYKYPNSTRSNRATSHGFWKVTGRGRKITDRDTNVIGIKKNLVFYEGRVTNSCKTNWVIHEYHDDMLPSDQRTHILCWLKNNDKKKIKGKAHQLVDDERWSNNSMIFDHINQANTCMSSEEPHLSNMSLTIQIHSQSNEATSSMTQRPPQLNESTDSITQPVSQVKEVTDSMTQPASQVNEATDSMTQPASQVKEATDSMTQPASQVNEATDSMTQPVSQVNEATDSMTQPASQVNEATDSMTQRTFPVNEVTDVMIQPTSQISKAADSRTHPLSQSNEATGSMTQPPFQSDETMNPVLHAPPEPNSVDGALISDTDTGELGYSLFDDGEFDLPTSLWQQPPSMEGLFRNDGNV